MVLMNHSLAIAMIRNRKGDQWAIVVPTHDDWREMNPAQKREWADIRLGLKEGETLHSVEMVASIRFHGVDACLKDR
jgi:hypothetical protein